jgi:hypothetical protein
MNKLDPTTRREQIAELSSSQCRTVIYERIDDIITAFNEAISEATEAGEKFPKLKFGLAVTVDLECNKVNTKLNLTRKITAEAEDALPDPDQLEMELNA